MQEREKKGAKDRQNRQKTNSKRVYLNPTILLIALHVNDMRFLQEVHIAQKDTNRIKIEKKKKLI